MEPTADFKELCALLNAHQVEYLVVGAYALAIHGAPRFTGDLDIFLHPTPDNARRVLAALAEFGFEFPNLTVDDFQTPNRVVQLGVVPVRVDLITAISGVSWDQAWAGKVAGTFGDIPVFYLGRQQIIDNKRAAGRKKDLADLDALGEV